MISGSAAAGAGVPGVPFAAGTGCASRSRNSLREISTAPILAKFSFPPVWSGCTCVLTINRTGSFEICLIAAAIFRAQRRELSVHHEDAVRARQHANRAALAVERVEVVGEFGGLDLYLAEIGLPLALGNMPPRPKRQTQPALLAPVNSTYSSSSSLLEWEDQFRFCSTSIHGSIYLPRRILSPATNLAIPCGSRYKFAKTH